MDLKKALGESLRQIRTQKKLTQEDFSQISSRTYMSALERGIYSPTAEKLDSIASVLRVHPVTILAQTYLRVNSDIGPEELLRMVQEELLEIDKGRSSFEEKA
jgi:transcriptional regulator with XRE-family HTH domain